MTSCPTDPSAVVPTKLKFAVVSPYGNLRGIYIRCDTNEGRPAYTRVMKEGMDSTKSTCIYFCSIFGPGARWFFGEYLPESDSRGHSMRSYCMCSEETAYASSPDVANWPCEDIFEIREATNEDEENEYFFPGPPSARPESGGYRSGKTGCMAKSHEEDLRVLGLDVGELPNMATLRATYRKLALKLHPDREGGDKEKFQIMQNAYERLVEEVTRRGGGLHGESPEPAQTGAGKQAPTTTKTDQTEPNQSAETLAQPELPPMSEEERKERRQKALDAALKRQQEETS